jgi:hypothetical protein
MLLSVAGYGLRCHANRRRTRSGSLSCIRARTGFSAGTQPECAGSAWTVSRAIRRATASRMTRHSPGSQALAGGHPRRRPAPRGRRRGGPARRTAGGSRWWQAVRGSQVNRPASLRQPDVPRGGCSDGRRPAGSPAPGNSPGPPCARADPGIASCMRAACCGPPGSGPVVRTGPAAAATAARSILPAGRPGRRGVAAAAVSVNVAVPGRGSCAAPARARPRRQARRAPGSCRREQSRCLHGEAARRGHCTARAPLAAPRSPESRMSALSYFPAASGASRLVVLR